MDGGQDEGELAQMDDIVDDEFEITIESPRQEAAGDQDDGILKLIQLRGNNQSVEGYSGIPAIVVTDAYEDKGNEDCVANGDEEVGEEIVLETDDNFTAVVKDDGEIDDKSAELKKDMSENQDTVVFTNLADVQAVTEVAENIESDTDKGDQKQNDLTDAQEMNVVVVEESPIRDPEAAENVQSDMDKGDQKQEDLSSTVQEVVQSDIKTADATEEDQKLEPGTEEQLPETEETKQSPDVTGESDEKEVENTMEHTSSGDGIAKVQLEESVELEEGSVSLDSILVKEKAEDSDPDEFDFELPPPKELPPNKSKTDADKQVTFKATDPVSVVQQSATESSEKEDTKETVAIVTDANRSDIKVGNKPVAVIKPTTQVPVVDVQPKNQAPAAPVSVDQQRNQRVLESAQAEWENVTTITAGYSDKGTVQGPEPTVIATTPAMSPHEMTEYLKTADFSDVKSSIRTGLERRGFSAFVHMLFGPPKLSRTLIEERDRIFCTAASPLNNENSYHTRTLQTIYRCLTGSKFDCSRTGSHWEEIGFQGNDPATDLRGAGLLGLVNLLFFLKDPKRQAIAHDIYKLSLHPSQVIIVPPTPGNDPATDLRGAGLLGPVNLLFFLKDPKRQAIAHDIYKLSLHPSQNFPFCVMGINMSRITLQSLREDLLNKECNRRGDVLGVVNDFYMGLYLQMFQVWKSQGKTIQDSGFVIKDLEMNAKKNPRNVLKNLDDYLNKKKTVIVAERLPDSGGDNFLSLCDDET